MQIVFDNSCHSGKVKLTLDFDDASSVCKNWKISGTGMWKINYSECLWSMNSYNVMTCACGLQMVCCCVFSAQKSTHYLLIFDGFVIVICLISAVLCTRSIILAVKLLQVNLPGNLYITEYRLIHQHYSYFWSSDSKWTHAVLIYICAVSVFPSHVTSSLCSGFLDSALRIIIIKCVKMTRGSS